MQYTDKHASESKVMNSKIQTSIISGPRKRLNFKTTTEFQDQDGGSIKWKWL